jgi:hypothetical protein
MLTLLATLALAQEPTVEAPPTETVAETIARIPSPHTACGTAPLVAGVVVVPVTPSSFTDATLERLPVRATSDVLALVPGMMVDRWGGVHAGAYGGGAPVYYIDGIRVMTY